MIQDTELTKLFSPFGEIEFIDLHRDPYTQKCKGYAFIQFKRSNDAKEAISAMNGFKLADQELKVGYATQGMQVPPGMALENGGTAPGMVPTMPGGIGHTVLVLKNMFDSKEVNLK